MAKRHLVTGCAGFIGWKVSELLVCAGHEVLGVDNLDDAYDRRLKQWRLARLENLAGFQFLRLDVADRVALEGAFADNVLSAGVSADRPLFEAVIHLAARAGVRDSVARPEIYYRANCDGTLNVLEMCRRLGIPKLVLASTSSVYGQSAALPYREQADTDRPLSPYAASKKAAETLAYVYHYLHGLDVSVVRYFTVYGPAGRPDMSVFRFVRRIAEDEPLVLFGDGSQQRDFTYVDDAARGTIAALRPLGYEVINLGAGQSIALTTMIDQIAGILGRNALIEPRPAHEADVPRTWADITKAKQLLDWEPRIFFDQGIRRTVDWYREHLELARTIELGDR